MKKTISTPPTVITMFTYDILEEQLALSTPNALEVAKGILGRSRTSLIGLPLLEEAIQFSLSEKGNPTHAARIADLKRQVLEELRHSSLAKEVSSRNQNQIDELKADIISLLTEVVERGIRLAALEPAFRTTAFLSTLKILLATIEKPIDETRD